MKKISFIVPVYNVEDYIESCLDSILNVKYPNKEIILINDGSTDNSEEICRAYKNKYENIILINKENEGLSEARNDGILASTGEYLFFIDSDDFYSYDFTIDINDIINNNAYDVILFNYQYYYQQSNKMETAKSLFKKNKLISDTGVQILKYIFENKVGIQWIVVQGIYNREFLVKNNLFFNKGRYYEDMLWLPEVFIRANAITYIDRELYVYRLEREGQITSSISEKTMIDNLYILTYWEDKLREMNLDKLLRKSLMQNFITRYYYIIWYNNFLPKNERINVQKFVNENKKYLHITNSIPTKVTSILVKLFGIKLTSYIFYLIIKSKKYLENHGNRTIISKK